MNKAVIFLRRKSDGAFLSKDRYTPRYSYLGDRFPSHFNTIAHLKTVVTTLNKRSKLYKPTDLIDYKDFDIIIIEINFAKILQEKIDEINARELAAIMGTTP
jgi:hypothetical protein